MDAGATPVAMMRVRLTWGGVKVHDFTFAKVDAGVTNRGTAQYIGETMHGRRTCIEVRPSLSIGAKGLLEMWCDIEGDRPIWIPIDSLTVEDLSDGAAPWEG